MRHRMSFKAGKSILEKGLSNVFGGKDGWQMAEECAPILPLPSATQGVH